MSDAALAIERYFDWRAEKERLSDELKEVERVLASLEQHMLAIMIERGEKEIKTSLGTAYMQDQTRVKVLDKDAWLDYVFNTNARHLLTTHVAKIGVKELTEFNGRPPPGLELTTFTVCNVRKS